MMIRVDDAHSVAVRRAAARSRSGSTTATSSGGRRSTTSRTTSPRCSRRYARGLARAAHDRRAPRGVVAGRRRRHRGAARRPAAAAESCDRRRRARCGTAGRTAARDGAARRRAAPRPPGGASTPRCARSSASVPTPATIDATEEFADRYVAPSPLPGRRPARRLGRTTRQRSTWRPTWLPRRKWSRRPRSSRRSTSARRRTLGLLAPVPDERAARPGLGADVAVVLGPRAHRPLRGAVARARARRRARRPTPRSTTSTTRSSTRAASGPRSPSSTPPVRARSTPTVRARALDVLERSSASISTAAIRCSPTASSTGWSCSTSTSTTRPCSPRSSSWTTTRTPPPTATPSDAARRHTVRRRLPPRRPGPRRRRSRWAPTPTRGPTTTNARRTSSTLAPFRIDTTPVTNARLRRTSSTTAATTTRALDRGRLGVAHRGRARRTAVLGPRGRRALDAPALRPRRGPVPLDGAGAARVLVRGRRVRALGRRAPADRGRVGGGRRRARRSHGAEPLARGHRAGSHRRRSGTRPTPARARAGVHEMLGDVWEWTASDFAAYPGFRSFPYREYSEVFFGPEYKVLRGGSWATHPPRCAPRSATGTTRSAARSSPASAARGTPDRLMCRHLAYLGPPVPLARAPVRRAALARPPGRAYPATRPRATPTPTAGASRGARRTGAPPPTATAPSPDVGRPTRSRRAPRRMRSGAFLAAARLASPGATLVDTGNAPFVDRHVVVLAQRHRPRLPRRRRRRAPRAGSRRAPARGSTATPTPRCCSRWCSTASTAGMPPADALAAVGARRPRRHHRATSTCCSPTEHACTPPASATRCSAAARSIASEPLDDEPGWVEVPDHRSTVAHPRRQRRRDDHCSHSSDRPPPTDLPRRELRMTSDVTVDVHLDADDTARALEADVRAGSRCHAEDAAAEVVLRRPRLRAVRRDHPAARVLPDPHRAVDPRRARGRRRRAHRGRHARRARLGHVGEDPHPPRRAPRRGHARALRAVRRERADPARRGRRDRARVRRRRRARGRRRLRAPPRRAPRRRHSARRLPRQHHRQPRARTAGASSSPTSRRRSRRATRCCSAPTS